MLMWAVPQAGRAKLARKAATPGESFFFLLVMGWLGVPFSVRGYMENVWESPIVHFVILCSNYILGLDAV